MRAFISYSHKDEAHFHRLHSHLSSLARQRLISIWDDQQIRAGSEWERNIHEQLANVDLFLLLITSNFVASSYCWDVELKVAMARRARGDAEVIPIMVSPVDIAGTPLTKLQMVPRGAKPVTKWGNRDEAWADVAKRIRELIESLPEPPVATAPLATAPRATPSLIIRANQLTPGGVLRGEHVRAIVEILGPRGGLALIPSDTCYSLAAHPTGITMSKRINQILDRVVEPISLAFDGLPRVEQWVQLNELSRRLFAQLTPGALTVVCPASDRIDPAIVRDALIAPDQTIGVRIPDSRIETQLVSEGDYPLTTVAVRTIEEKKAVTDFEQARQIVEEGIASLGEPIPFAVVEGRLPFRDAHSTVVRVPSRKAGEPFDLIRQGDISLEEISNAAK